MSGERRLVVPRDTLRAGLGSLTLPAEASHYALVVLRLGDGARVALVDGAGMTARGRLRVEGSAATVELEEIAATADRESPLAIELWCAIPKGDRWDWIIQKATELGVSVIQPLHTARGEVKVPEERLSGRLPRWQRISDEAARQCRRARAAELRPPRTIGELTSSPSGDDVCAIAAHSSPSEELPTTPLHEVLASAPPEVARLAVGPEGGFTDAEALRLRSAGFHLVGLGPRILRVETAAVIGVGLLQHAWGDLG